MLNFDGIYKVLEKLSTWLHLSGLSVIAVTTLIASIPEEFNVRVLALGIVLALATYTLPMMPKLIESFDRRHRPVVYLGTLIILVVALIAALVLGAEIYRMLMKDSLKTNMQTDVPKVLPSENNEVVSTQELKIADSRIFDRSERQEIDGETKKLPYDEKIFKYEWVLSNLNLPISSSNTYFGSNSYNGRINVVARNPVNDKLATETFFLQKGRWESTSLRYRINNFQAPNLCLAPFDNSMISEYYAVWMAQDKLYRAMGQGSHYLEIKDTGLLDLHPSINSASIFYKGNEEEVIFAGGFDDEGQPVSNVVSFNFKELKAKRLSSLITPRGGGKFVSGVAGKRVCGDNKEKTCASVDVFEEDKERWKNVVKISNAPNSFLIAPISNPLNYILIDTVNMVVDHLRIANDIDYGATHRFEPHTQIYGSFSNIPTGVISSLDELLFYKTNEDGCHEMVGYLNVNDWNEL